MVVNSMIGRRAMLVGGGLASLLGGCAGGALRGDKDGPYAPGLASGQDVDGLIVGHRLMEAGEYELALRAYYRAASEQGATVDVLSAIGSADLKLGRLNQAEMVLRNAIEKDGTFVPAWNNLGVVLMEEGKYAEAARVFRTAYALDNGNSDLIRDNLKRAMAKAETPEQPPEQAGSFKLVRRGIGEYRLLTK